MLCHDCDHEYVSLFLDAEQMKLSTVKDIEEVHVKQKIILLYHVN